MKPIVGVHGFGYEPAEMSNDPHLTLYEGWREKSQPHALIGFGWYSYPFGLRHTLRAWMQGYLHRYSAAWNKAIKEAPRLADVTFGLQQSCFVIAHSLGTRLVLEALRYEHNIEKIVLLSGSDSVPHARKCVAGTDVQILNVIVPADDVLEWPGSWFTPTFGRERIIGYHGFPSYDNVTEVELGEATSHWDAYSEKYWPRWLEFFSRGRVQLH